MENVGEDEMGGAFGCGGIDIKGGGPSGPTDPGGPATFLAMLLLPFVMKRGIIDGNIFIVEHGRGEVMPRPDIVIDRRANTLKVYKDL